MAGTVKVPGLGPVPKTEMTIGLVVVVVLAGAYFLRKRQAAAAAPAAAATATNQYPPDGTTGNPSDPYSTDPATGATYGDEAAGSGGTFGAFPFGQGLAAADAGTTAGTTTTPGGPPFSSNSEWSNWVIQQAQANNPDINVGALTNAIGLYLNGQPLDAPERQLVFDATAIGGDPPVAGANGYPPKLRSSGGKGGATHAVNPVTGLHSAGGGKIAWERAAHATGYKVSLSGGARRSDTTSGTSWTFHGVRAGTYTASVLAVPAAAGARPATVSVTVK